MQKMNVIPRTVFEKLKFKKSCNLTDGEHFGLQLENQIFPRHVLGPNLSRLPSYLHNTIFQNSALSLLSISGKISLCKKLRKPTEQSCEKCVTDRRIERQVDR